MGGTLKAMQDGCEGEGPLSLTVIIVLLVFPFYCVNQHICFKSLLASATRCTIGLIVSPI